MAADSQDDGSEEQYPWVSMTPVTRLRGNVTEIFTPQTISADDEQTDSSYGIVLEDPEVVNGEVYVNDQKPDDGTVRDVADDDSSNPTDYRVADADDRSVTVISGVMETDEESTVDGDLANTYNEGEFADDTVLLWVNGLAGERIIRHLDFNGRPYAKFTDNGPVYGLFQGHDDWFQKGADRSQLASEGKAPRLTRPPILRPDADDVLIDLTASDDGKYRSYRGHVFDTEAFRDEFDDLTTPVKDMPTGEYGLEAESELNLRMADFDEANDVINAQDYSFEAMFREGDGWGEVPDDYESDSGGSSMSVETAGDTDTSGGSDDEQDQTAIETIVQAMEADTDAHGATPDEYLAGGIEGFVESNEDEWDETPTGDRLDAIRESIYSELAWLSAEELVA